MIAAALLLAAAAAGAPDDSGRRAEVINAIRRGADHAQEVLISKTGEGRTEYDLLRGEWSAYETHWHTAQVAYGLIEAWRLTGEKGYLKTARRAGDWWISTEFKAPHPLAGLVNAAHGDALGPLINMTTVTDGANALFALARAAGELRYAQSLRRSGDWFLERAYLPDEGLFYNIVDPETGAVWRDRSPHHKERTPDTILITEVARPNSEGYLYAELCAFTGDDRYCDVFLNVAEKKLERQSPEGPWMDFEPNDPATGKVHPRFNIWLAEAQLEAYAMTGDRRFLESARRVGRFMAKAQRPDGGFYRALKIDGSSQRGDYIGSAAAFSGLLWLRLRDYGAGEEFGANIERAVDWLLANQGPEHHPDPNLRGAFLNLWARERGGRTLLLQRDIGTAFALRFLTTYVRDLDGADVNDDPLTWRGAEPEKAK